MPNQTYYEILGVAPTVTANEIELACDTLYNKWRALVNHPDQQVVAQANQALHSVETIRATLADPNKRESYDMGIGLKGVVSGLIDPTALLQQQAMLRTPPVTGQGRPDANSTARVDSWVCPKCSTTNAVGTRFCKKCGNALSVTCMKCGQLAEAGTVHCPSCGVSLKEAARAKEEQDREAELLSQREAKRQAALQPIINASQEASSRQGCAFAIFFIWMVSLPLAWSAMKRAQQALALPAVAGDQEYRDRAAKALKWSRGFLTVYAWIFGLGILAGIIAAIANG